MTADPSSYIEAALKELSETLSSKNEDYRIGDGEFSNFEFASQVTGSTTKAVILSQLAIKLGRIKGQHESGTFNYESLKDSYKDLAGYAIILYAHELREGEDSKPLWTENDVKFSATQGYGPHGD